ncbi:Uncharacterized protein YpiB, UPF0302 family [Pelagirhabdus alkalitolerans]|uniref:UPF0302 protein SAMN05421734_102416 n=1 Tax=Pelagirhabdus alkalitolerans TaxID=1612202 RepID=A0A1G6HAC4_9BACI|nr:ReoY family proteolytic degradation factor [Pelagirhabdus alkalitolerans]SDB91220.1 Uncharacterized protein YpiB, UPF0302 family [Pelagirhabdus alkalitolerans]
MMNVTVEEKKAFINWFLDHYKLKKRESMWILSYLTNHDQYLKHVHFTNYVRHCPRGVFMSTTCSKQLPFRFYKDHLITSDADKSFHELRLNQDDPIYIELSFEHDRHTPEYVAVLEENPYLPDDFHLSDDDKQFASKWLDETLYHAQKDRLTTEIDRALDNRDHLLFHELIQQLNAMKNTEQQKNSNP